LHTSTHPQAAYSEDSKKMRGSLAYSLDAVHRNDIRTLDSFSLQCLVKNVTVVVS